LYFLASETAATSTSSTAQLKSAGGPDRPGITLVRLS
jgi:hypothetical protein